MTSIRDKLIEDYAEHYARVNAGTDPSALPARRFRHIQAQYHGLVQPLPKGSRVLDLGCGTGMLLSWLGRQPNLVPVGVDSSSSQIAVAQKALPNLEIHCADGLEFLRARPGSFAAIFCTDVLEHIPGKDLLGEWVELAAQALQPGGFFFCRMPNAANIIGSYCRYRDLTHECSFTTTSILQLLESAGLENCRVYPIRAAGTAANVRMAVEYYLHRWIFRICGEKLEHTFTTNICALGYRAADGAS
jgi:2-polyprenyl-3-methyl-5-hydroxy-6-metoxy-1,4-benzoquinol methylase